MGLPLQLLDRESMVCTAAGWARTTAIEIGGEEIEHELGKNSLDDRSRRKLGE
jgi:hypothetical protein